jgi:hypothetical protein
MDLTFAVTTRAATAGIPAEFVGVLLFLAWLVFGYFFGQSETTGDKVFSWTVGLILTGLVFLLVGATVRFEMSDFQTMNSWESIPQVGVGGMLRGLQDAYEGENLGVYLIVGMIGGFVASLLHPIEKILGQRDRG